MSSSPGQVLSWLEHCLDMPRLHIWSPVWARTRINKWIYKYVEQQIPALALSLSCSLALTLSQINKYIFFIKNDFSLFLSLFPPSLYSFSYYWQNVTNRLWSKTGNSPKGSFHFLLWSKNPKLSSPLEKLFWLVCLHLVPPHFGMWRGRAGQ